MLVRCIQSWIMFLCLTHPLFAIDQEHAHPAAPKTVVVSRIDPEQILDDFEDKLKIEPEDKKLIDETIKVNKPKDGTHQLSPKSKSARTKKHRNKIPTKIDELDALIQEYQHRLDIIEADLARLQSDLNDNSKNDNKILIDLKRVDATEFKIRQLTAKLDGNILFDLNDLAGFSFPNNQMRIFHGPLMPGRHSIEIEANISDTDSGVNLAAQRAKSTSSRFDIDIPDGRTRKYFSIEISRGIEGDTAPKIKLVESEYK
jgi:hypothetical protein